MIRNFTLKPSTLGKPYQLAMLALVLALIASCNSQPAKVDAPKVLSAASLSSTGLEVVFSKAVGPEASLAANYSISPDLAVSKAVLSADKTKATLTTATQSNQQYTVTVSNVKDLNANALDASAKSATFSGTPELAKVVSAASVSSTGLEVSFSKAMGSEAAVATNYTITPALAISNAALSADKTKVTLTTATQSSIQYTVTVFSVKDQSGNALDPASKSSTFTGTGVSDLPKLVGAVSLSNTALELSFSKPLSPEALTATNYTIVPALAVSDAVLSGDKTKVVLTTASQNNIQYTVTVSNLKDLAGNDLEPTGKSVSFAGIPLLIPKVVAAVSLSNTTLEVTFNKAANPEAAIAGNYAITPALAVSDAVLSSDKTKVVLTTATQSSIQYTLTVSNVKDLSGNTLDPANHKASFNGTSPASTPGDSDGDGLSNTDEAAGWNVAVKKGDGTLDSRKVTSDPALADTDSDGLSDKDERQSFTDPRTADTDQDGLSDFDELKKWGSSPNDVDSDGDSKGNPAFFDGNELGNLGTSPTLSDTDGDKISDYDEVLVRGGAYNPLIANVPQMELSLEGTTDLSVNVKQTSTNTVLGTKTASLTQGNTSSTSSTDTQSRRVEASVSTTVGVEVKGGLTGGVTASSSVTVSTGFSNEKTRSYTGTSSQSAEQTSQEALSEGSETGKAIDNGRIGVGFKVKNAGDVSFKLENLTITALFRDPADPTQFKTITTLTPPISAGGITLASNSQTGVLDARNIAIPASQALELMAHPGNLFFQFSTYNLTDDEGRNFEFLKEKTLAQTALVVIDYGNGNTRRVRVATNVERQNGLIVGVSMKKVLENILKLPYTTGVGSTGAKVLTGLFDAQAGQNIVAEPANHVLWAAIGSANLSIPAGTHFEDILLKPGTEMHLLYVQDRDNDNLFASEEYFYGTSDNNPDSDSDGLKDGEEVKQSWTVAVVGKTPRQVFSNHRIADFDQDTLNDAQEKQLGTDPYKADTDGDAIPDATDSRPLEFRLKQMTLGTSNAHIVAVRPDDTVVVWGDNSNGQHNIPSGLANVIGVAAGIYHILALKSDGTVVAWGGDPYGNGQLNIPSGLANVVRIAANNAHNLALKSDGTVVAWGFNSAGQTNIPSGLSNVVDIAAGLAHNLALKSDGTVVGWGANFDGQINIPSGLSGVVAIGAGFGHSLALKSDGTVVGWGRNDEGQINIPSGLSGVVAIAVGNFHSLALKSDGSVVGWGNNTNGQLNIPSGLSNVVDIVTGSAHSLALKSDGTVVGWGSNNYGQLNIPSGLVVMLP